MRKFVYLAFLVIGSNISGVSHCISAPTAFLTPDDRPIFQAALKSAADGDWEIAKTTIDLCNDSLPKVILEWLFLQDTEESIAPERVTRFLKTYPNWPNEIILRHKLERALMSGEKPAMASQWLENNTPKTYEGKVRLIKILMDDKNVLGATKLIKSIWLNEKFSSAEEQNFLKRYGKMLSVPEHNERLDNLLWQSRTTEARRMLYRVTKEVRSISIARIYLLENHLDVDLAISRVPKTLRDHPGLIYERVKWRRRANKNESARALLFSLPELLPHHAKWWKEINYQIRESLDEGLISDAFRLAVIGSQLEGHPHIEASWMAGWIALEFLKEPEIALSYFKRMLEHVSMPISLARAAYWAGRSATDSNNYHLASYYFEKAAYHKTTFYGQLAGKTLNLQDSSVPRTTGEKKSTNKKFEQSSLIRAAKMFGEVGDPDLMKRFILHALPTAPTSTEVKYLAGLGNRYNYPHICISAAKQILRGGALLLDELYPIPSQNAWVTDEESKVGLALIYSLTRQESEMNPKATSAAGALGLMQLMPATANQMANKLGLTFDKSRLTNDTNYNLVLGTTYLSGLIKRYNGSLTLALAAYNAGPKNVRKWIRRYGDPTRNEIDEVDWIEQLPYPETRNYIQRVLEGTAVYNGLIMESSL